MIHKVKQTAKPLEHDIPTKHWHSLTLDKLSLKALCF